MAALALALAILAAYSNAAQAGTRSIGDTTILAAVLYPGHPGGIAIDGNTAYVGHLLITNLAIRAPEKSAVLGAWVNDKGLPLVRPPIP